jgi:hypothetical protein
VNRILLENGDALLKEDGGFLLLESGSMVQGMGYLQSAVRGFRSIIFLLIMGV